MLPAEVGHCSFNGAPALDGVASDQYKCHAKKFTVEVLGEDEEYLDFLEI